MAALADVIEKDVEADDEDAYTKIHRCQALFMTQKIQHPRPHVQADANDLDAEGAEIDEAHPGLAPGDGTDDGHVSGFWRDRFNRFACGQAECPAPGVLLVIVHDTVDFFHVRRGRIVFQEHIMAVGAKHRHLLFHLFSPRSDSVPFENRPNFRWRETSPGPFALNRISSAHNAKATTRWQFVLPRACQNAAECKCQHGHRAYQSYCARLDIQYR